MVRALSLLAYAAFAALGAGLLARPALAWLLGLGLLRRVLPAEVPLGGLSALLLLAIAAATLRLAVAAALERRAGLRSHLVLLVLAAAALVLRGVAGAPGAPRDPAPALLDAVRAAADAADAHYASAKAYSLDEAALDASLSRLPRPGFTRFGRALPLRARIVGGALGPQLAALPGDGPGTIYLAVSGDRQRSWITALGLRGVLTSSGRPVMIQARAGTHSAPGRDPLVPVYPGMKPALTR